MLRFKSLPVNGDSFLILNNEESYLVDAGRSEAITGLIPNNINIAICTHNDADHAGGFIYILQNESIKINEMWLPAIWQPLISFLIDYENKMIEDDELEIVLDDFIDYDDQDFYSLTTTENQYDESNEFMEQMKSVSKYAAIKFISNLYFTFSGKVLLNRNYIRNPIRNLTINLDRIFQIARMCIERSIPIVWFEPSIVNGKGIKNFKPLNSKRLMRLRKVSLKNFFKLLKLSPTNRYSLVFEFLYHETPLIILNADSDPLNVKYNSPYKKVLAIATHHGSETNKQVYNEIYSNTGDHITWIRSGGTNRRHHPGKTFRSLSALKYCSVCYPNKQFPIAPLEFKYNKNLNCWQHVQGGFTCNC
ncbi:MBL fold metallo-hydrolase [Bacillus sp. OVS6]|nr:MBL fold metallo-hydrolase [Bacillus sp. OVS6]